MGKLRFVLLSSAIVLGGSGTSWAQTGLAPAEQAGTPPASTTDSGTGIGEITVTAQRRSESLQRVPVAVAVATASQLQAAGVAGVQNLKIVAPGVEVQSNAFYALPSIRGVGSKSTGAGLETPVAIYVDGVYYAAATGNVLSFNNIAQVEVLKGPQGTLFGRNATAGLIQITTRDPKEKFGGEVNLSYGNYQTFKGDFYVTGGLADGIATDLAVQGTAMGKGYGINLLDGKDIYRIHHDIAARSKTVWNIGDDTTARLILDYMDTKNSMNANRLTPGTTPPAPFGPVYGGSPWDNNSDFQHPAKISAGGISLRVDHDLGPVQLASITAYRETHQKMFLDLDYTPVIGRQLTSVQRDKQFSQELQLLSDTASPVKWVAGLYYFHAPSSYKPQFVRFLGPAVVNTPGGQISRQLVDSTQGTDSKSIFGQATFPLLEGLNLTGGLRYTDERRSLSAYQEIERPNGQIIVTFPRFKEKQRYKKLTWRLSADYAFTDDVLGYVSYNRGFKSGGFNPSALTIGAFEPEVLDAYEAGLKTTLFDRRLRLNGAAFYYDYKGVQVLRTVNGTAGIYNADGEEVYGFDVDGQLRLTRALTVSGGYQYLHSRYKSFPGAVTATPRPEGGYTMGTGDVAGNRVVLTPKSTLSLAGDYLLELRQGDLNLNVSYYYNSGFYHEVDNLLRQPAYSLINASLRWRNGSGLSVSLWGQNLTNEAVANFEGVQTYGATGAARTTYAAPRTYGVTVGTTF